jgi:acyl-CoA ligase (AMP-forming) (exosortase A-associated)
MLLEAFLERSFAEHPDKTALVCGAQRLSYGDLERQCNRVAHGLIALGVARGDRVAICLDNSVEAVVAVFATLKAGAVFVMLNPTIKAEKLAFVLDNSEAGVLIAGAAKLEELRAQAPALVHLKAAVAAGRAASDGRLGPIAVTPWSMLLLTQEGDVPPRKRCIDVDLAALIYTSGSTGNPKGVMLTHQNMVAAATSITTYLENRADDVILNVLPLSFDYGLYQVLMAMKFGGTVVLEKSFAYPQAVLQRLASKGVTGFPIVPTMSAILLQMDLAAHQFPSLRYITNTGAALPTDHIVRLRQAFPGVRLYSMFGLTECKRVSYLPPEQLDRRPTSVGKAMPNVEVYIVDENGGRLPPGEVGELVVRGANVMRGYWKLPEETARMLRPGPIPGERVLYTGDLFRMDEEGYLYWTGRRDDIIKSRGEKVSPKEVENVLYSLPGVAMAAVIGVADPVLGQAIKAVISRSDGGRISEQDVLRHCALHLEDFMVPKKVEFRDKLPRTPTGKIDKRQLALDAGAGRAD